MISTRLLQQLEKGCKKQTGWKTRKQVIDINSLVEDLTEFYDDPYGYVMYVYPWGTDKLPEVGPENWQKEVLLEITRQMRLNKFDGINAVDPIRIAVRSGHGSGKSALMSWILQWLMDTKPNLKATVTANTFHQMFSRTWVQFAKWHKLCLTRQYTKISSTRNFLGMQANNDEFKQTWGAYGHTSDEGKSESFAGQHEKGGTSAYLFDEASAIPDKIWEVASGGLVSGQSFMIAMGNPTLGFGHFFDIFVKFTHRWYTKTVDTRTCSITNKVELQKWIEDWGIDSDFVRVRILGLPPNENSMKFFSRDIIDASMEGENFPLMCAHYELVIGIDIGRDKDPSVIRARRGLDGRTIKSIVIKSIGNTTPLVATICEFLNKHKGYAACFIDMMGPGGPIIDQLIKLGYRIIGIKSGKHPPTKPDLCTDHRAEMWYLMRDWMRCGGCVDKDKNLESELCEPQINFDDHGRIVLETKRHMQSRGVGSTNDADALALTFAMPIASSVGSKQIFATVQSEEID